MVTPFGVIYSTNITPDPQTGIGTWSEAAFRRAMHEGVSRDGSHLFPALSYDHFTKLSDEDVRAVGSRKRQKPCERLIEGDAQAVEVTAGIDRPIHPSGLLGGHVGERAGDRLGSEANGARGRRLLRGLSKGGEKFAGG